MDHLANIQELEALLQQQAALFYHVHRLEAAARLKRQGLREELIRILASLGAARVASQASWGLNMLAALSVRSATLKHQIAVSSAQIGGLAEQAELAEDCYEETLQQLEAQIGEESGMGHP